VNELENEELDEWLHVDGRRLTDPHPEIGK